MKILKIKPGTLQINELAENIHRHFNAKYSITDNNLNEIILAESSSIGCKLILTKKRLLITGTFPTKGSLILAMCILILGAVIIPMLIYIIVFKKKFEGIENEVQEYVLSEFKDRLV